MDITLSAKSIMEAAETGNALAVRVINEAADYLGLALSQISCVIDAQGFVMGGGVSNAGSFFIDLIEKSYYKYDYFSCGKKVFLKAKLGNSAGMYGAARMALNSFWEV